ncbi:hypothetical protein Raf01_39150 [Rugosimonospora africana]|uniref:Uncharacterized protein n=1 Tax=Rugosimonospora africana TaxID=556532 RepID=A0A8J3QU45_9ACTN|nr:hypothetical protein Raf01_39150 [Rugosimonospora africana]
MSDGAAVASTGTEVTDTPVPVLATVPESARDAAPAGGGCAAGWHPRCGRPSLVTGQLKRPRFGASRLEAAS